ncbi:MAG: Y-family DNA polymerase [Xanthobacteraceae bacterium]
MTAPSATRRYLSVWLSRLATDRIARSAAPDEGTGHALVVVAPIKSALRLTALNDAAARLGLKTGMALADARAMYPRLDVKDADPLADRHLLETVAEWCDRYTPLVGMQPPDGLILDISGCAHLFGGEAALCDDLVRRLSAQGLLVRAAIADTVGCAWALARYGDSSFLIPADGMKSDAHDGPHHQSLPHRGRVVGEADRVGDYDEAQSSSPHPAPSAPPSPFRGGMKNLGDCLIVPPGGAREALAPLPLAALRLAPEVVTLLAQVGLKHIADLLQRPRATLAARFGTELILRLDQALGVDEESITPRQPLPRYVAEQRFAEPIALERAVLGTIQRLADRLRAKLEQHGEGARLIEVVLFRLDGKVLRVTAATSRPIRDAVLIRRLFAERLAAIGDAHDPGFGFDTIRLSVIVAEPLAPQQTGFNACDRTEDLSELIDRLGARVGFSCVLRFVPHDTHIPEFAAVEVPANLVQPAAFKSVGSQDSLAPLRPIKLFARPEPIDAVAEVPDGPPVRFRWRHVLHEVARAEGPERLAMEWWRDAAGTALTRDYFRIESREGARFWVYRAGLYERETGEPRWYLHGLFA